MSQTWQRIRDGRAVRDRQLKSDWAGEKAGRAPVDSQKQLGRAKDNRTDAGGPSDRTGQDGEERKKGH